MVKYWVVGNQSVWLRVLFWPFRYCFELRIERMQSLKGDIYKALSICIVHRFLLFQLFLNFLNKWKKKQNSVETSKQNKKEELWKFVLQILLEFWLRNLFETSSVLINILYKVWLHLHNHDWTNCYLLLPLSNILLFPCVFLGY